MFGECDQQQKKSVNTAEITWLSKNFQDVERIANLEGFFCC